jgi:hypothetical protein
MRPLANGVAAVALVLVVGHALRGHHASHATASTAAEPAAPLVQIAPAETGRRVIATGKGSREDRCDVPGVVNGASVIFEVDTGDPDIADFAASYIGKLGIDPASLHWSEFDPGTRYGKTAQATAREIRVGDIVWTDEPITFWSNWRYSFGDDEIPLLGLSAVRSRGVQIEWMADGNCRLTVAQSSTPRQCDEYALSKMRSDLAVARCERDCSGVAWCRRLSNDQPLLPYSGGGR